METIRARLDPPLPDYSGIREPTQQRSRERVRVIKEGCARVLSTEGVHALSPRSVAEAAGVPMPALYRYFDDVEAIVMSLLMEFGQTYRGLTLLPAHERATEPEVPLREFLETGILGALDYFQQRPELGELFWRHPRHFERVKRALDYFNSRSAKDFHAAALNKGVASTEFTLERSFFAVEMLNRVYQIACGELGSSIDVEVVMEGITMLERYMTPFTLPSTTP